jgi:hypothetical protein
MKKTITVQLVKSSDKVETAVIGTFNSMPAAMRASKKAAGSGARFFTKGVDRGYSGPNGLAYII